MHHSAKERRLKHQPFWIESYARDPSLRRRRLRRSVHFTCVVGGITDQSSHCCHCGRRYSRNCIESSAPEQDASPTHKRQGGNQELPLFEGHSHAIYRRSWAGKDRAQVSNQGVFCLVTD